MASIHTECFGHRELKTNLTGNCDALSSGGFIAREADARSCRINVKATQDKFALMGNLRKKLAVLTDRESSSFPRLTRDKYVCSTNTNRALMEDPGPLLISHIVRGQYSHAEYFCPAW